MLAPPHFAALLARLLVRSSSSEFVSRMTGDGWLGVTGRVDPAPSSSCMIGRELGPLPLRFRLWLLEQCGRRSGRELHALVARSPADPAVDSDVRCDHFLSARPFLRRAPASTGLVALVDLRATRTLAASHLGDREGMPTTRADLHHRHHFAQPRIGGDLRALEGEGAPRAGPSPWGAPTCPSKQRERPERADSRPQPRPRSLAAARVRRSSVGSCSSPSSSLHPLDVLGRHVTERELESLRMSSDEWMTDVEDLPHFDRRPERRRGSTLCPR